MAKFLVNGTMLKCSEGAAPVPLVVGDPKVKGCGKPMANKNDTTIMGTFITCKKNPVPGKPCTPMIAPWGDTSSSVNVRGDAAINADCKTKCSIFQGEISVSDPGQEVVDNT